MFVRPRCLRRVGISSVVSACGFFGGGVAAGCFFPSGDCLCPPRPPGVRNFLGVLVAGCVPPRGSWGGCRGWGAPPGKRARAPGWVPGGGGPICGALAHRAAPGGARTNASAGWGRSGAGGLDELIGGTKSTKRKTVFFRFGCGHHAMRSDLIWFKPP